MEIAKRTILVLLLLLVLPMAAASEDRLFSFVFPCGIKKDMVCMTTELPPGQKLVLLGDRSNTCRAETGDTMNFHNAMEDKVISRIATRHCRNRSDYYLAYGGTEFADYRRYLPAAIDDEKLVRRVDTAIKSLKFYSSANEYFGNTLSTKPHLFHPVPGNDNIVIAQYTTRKPKDNMEKYGPVFMFINGEVREVAREASLGFTFLLDGRHYMTYRSGCWVGCGILAEVVVEISEEGFRKVLIDGFFAT